MPGTTSDLYAKDERGNVQPLETLSAPPAPPAPVVAVQPVVVKPRMADEKADGSMRDTSTEALRPGNDLNFRRVDEEVPKTKEPDVPPVVEVANEQAPAPVVEPPKLYAGKFKTVEDLEKSYQEAEKAMTQKAQEAAELRKQQQAAPPPAAKTAADLEKEKAAFLERFVNNPQQVIQEYQERATQQTMTALSAQQTAEDWRKSNPDLAPHEFFVAAESFRLSQSDPELAKDPKALLLKASDNFRQTLGAIRTEGAKEALTTETRVTPLLSSTAPSPATEQPSKAPLTADAAFDAHMQMLKSEERRSHQGLRR